MDLTCINDANNLCRSYFVFKGICARITYCKENALIMSYFRDFYHLTVEEEMEEEGGQVV